MTTIAATRAPQVPSGRYGLAEAARMEWIKLRSLRSTWWTLGRHDHRDRAGGGAELQGRLRGPD